MSRYGYGFPRVATWLELARRFINTNNLAIYATGGPPAEAPREPATTPKSLKPRRVRHVLRLALPGSAFARPRNYEEVSFRATFAFCLWFGITSAMIACREEQGDAVAIYIRPWIRRHLPAAGNRPADFQKRVNRRRNVYRSPFRVLSGDAHPAMRDELAAPNSLSAPDDAHLIRRTRPNPYSGRQSGRANPPRISDTPRKVSRDGGVSRARMLYTIGNQMRDYPLLASGFSLRHAPN